MKWMMNKLSVLFVFFVLFGCITYKDNRAVNRVEANVKLQDLVFFNALPLHPCINTPLKPIKDTTGTTTIEIIPPKPRPEPSNPNCPPCIPDTFKMKITKIFHDSIPFEDHQKIDILTDSLNEAKKAKAFMSGQMTEKDKLISGLKNTKLYLWLVIGLISAGGVGYTILKFKKNLPI
jgi:hypothetical protein